MGTAIGIMVMLLPEVLEGRIEPGCGPMNHRESIKVMVKPG
jgi:hypothetical protein